MSNLLEHRPRKMPFYAFGMSLRSFAWIAMVLCTVMVGSGNNGLLAACFLCCYFIRSSAMGISTLPYMDIISKSIEPQRRSRYFSLRQFAGGFFGIFIGFFFIRYILNPESGLVFPTNYAVLFGGARQVRPDWHSPLFYRFANRSAPSRGHANRSDNI